MWGSGQDAAEGIAEERRAPELESLAGGGFAANVAGLEADAIYYRYVHAVGDGVGALNGAPGVVLRYAELGFLGGMPADRGGIKEHRRALQRRQACALRKPLVPANQRAQAADAGIESAKSEIPRSEIKLFVIERIVGDVSLAVEAAERAVGIENGGGVVIDAGCALLKQRRNQDDAMLPRRRRKFFAAGAGDGFGQVEQRMIFALTKILALEQFGQADDLRSASGGVAHAFQSLGEILFRLGAARHLHQGHAKFVRGHGRPLGINISIVTPLSAVSYQPSARRGARTTHGGKSRGGGVCGIPP